MEGKSIFKSKTFYVNILAVIAMIVQGVTGNDIISLEIQATVLSVINIALRLITKESIVWS